MNANANATALPAKLMVGLALAISVFALGACAHSARRVDFQGLAADPKVLPTAIVEAPTVPRDAERLGRLSVRCEPVEAGESFTERSLVDVDCNEHRLRSLLREAAAQRGGDVLAEIACDGSGGLRCRATLARRPDEAPPLGPAGTSPGGTGAPAAARGFEGSPLIWVSFAATVPHFDRPPRERDAVRELASASAGQVTIGELETSCEDCADSSLREALLLSASRLGISDVVAVRCGPRASVRRCQADAAVFEEPGRVP